MIGCSSSVDSTNETITNNYTSRYYYIKHLDSYIIVPANFQIKDTLGAVDSTTGAFINWSRKEYLFDDLVSDIDSAYKAKIEYHKQTEPQLQESYQRSYYIINGVRAALLTCECYWDSTPEQLLTYRLILDRVDSSDMYIGNVEMYRKASVQDSLLYSLRSIIP